MNLIKILKASPVLSILLSITFILGSIIIFQLSLKNDDREQVVLDLYEAVYLNSDSEKAYSLLTDKAKSGLAKETIEVQINAAKRNPTTRSSIELAPSTFHEQSDTKKTFYVHQADNDYMIQVVLHYEKDQWKVAGFGIDFQVSYHDLINAEWKEVSTR
ncbi:hypothetical protein [Mechercharimyces sp. CAU 1602]|uniref:hypothetical protein n=1 Tax=Mechercharimyces sp. CAU 1602 TaxID=2973933 RepID=UPI002163BC34|nr:hypothetical protein [Mechercharimyces sp. CAU 1602]MCS1352808.1 hypothetical protein [Mechercharimyces sp. CAU 1602]